MKNALSVFIIVWICGCAVPKQTAPTEPALRPVASLRPNAATIVPSPAPMLIPNPADRSDRLVVFPSAPATGLYAWTALITDDLSQPFREVGMRYEWQGSSLIIHTQGMQNVFIQLQGTPQQP